MAGSDVYYVVIEKENDEILHMRCNCPYAADGNYCKHMAAVLYQFYGEDETEDETENKAGRGTYLERMKKEIQE